MSKRFVWSRNNLIVFLALAPLFLLAPGSFTYVENAETLLNPEAQKMPPVETLTLHQESTGHFCCMFYLSDAEASTSLGDDVNTSSLRLSCRMQSNPLHQKLISHVKEIQPVAGTQTISILHVILSLFHGIS